MAKNSCVVTSAPCSSWNINLTRGIYRKYEIFYLHNFLLNKFYCPTREHKITFYFIALYGINKTRYIISEGCGHISYYWLRVLICLWVESNRWPRMVGMRGSSTSLSVEKHNLSSFYHDLYNLSKLNFILLFTGKYHHFIEESANNDIISKK